MNFDWRIKTLGEVCDITSSKRIYRHEYEEEGIPFFRGKEIIKKAKYEEIKEILYISLERYEQIKQKFGVPKPGDILLTSVGTLGIPYMAKDDDIFYFKDGNLTWFKDYCECIDNKYLFYWLKSPQMKNQIEATRIGVAQPALTIVGLKSYKIPLPIQKKIICILSAYDDLIENNTRRIQILEEMAQRIYQEWFVNFRYPGHENDQLVKSELGMIPVGWEVKKLREFVLNVRQSERAGDHLLSIPYVPIDCIARKSLFLNSAKPGSEAKSSLISFQKYDVLFGAMRSYFHKVVISPFNGTTRTTCFVLRPIDPGYYAFTVLTLFRESTIDFANSHSRGSTMPYAVWDGGLAEMPAIYPSKEVALDFNKIVEPMLKRIALGFFEQKNLRQTRDFLLPKLISCKLDVSELDIDIGETDDSLQ